MDFLNPFLGSKIQKKNNNDNNFALQNYESLKDELSKILENQKIGKQKNIK